MKGLSNDEILKKYNLSPVVNGYVNINDTSKIPQSLWILVTSAVKGTTLPIQQVENEYYVVKVRDIKVGGTKTLSEVSEEIKNTLLASKQEEASKKLLEDFEKFRKDSKIEIRYKSPIVK